MESKRHKECHRMVHPTSPRPAPSSPQGRHRATGRLEHSCLGGKPPCVWHDLMVEVHGKGHPTTQSLVVWEKAGAEGTENANPRLPEGELDHTGLNKRPINRLQSDFNLRYYRCQQIKRLLPHPIAFDGAMVGVTPNDRPVLGFEVQRNENVR